MWGKDTKAVGVYVINLRTCENEMTICNTRIPWRITMIVCYVFLMVMFSVAEDYKKAVSAFF